MSKRTPGSSQGWSDPPGGQERLFWAILAPLGPPGLALDIRLPLRAWKLLEEPGLAGSLQEEPGASRSLGPPESS